MREIEHKKDKLKEIIAGMESIAIAYSGGVDSTFLCKFAHDILGDKVIAVTACSLTFPEREFKEADEFAKEINLKHIVITSGELDIQGFSDNPADRCYHCKKELFKKIKQVADSQGCKFMVDGSNADDLDDYRPGRKALAELKIRSPLAEAGLTKDDIRKLSKKYGIPTWNKPSFACLASRIPYGQKITAEKLKTIELAEKFLMEHGFVQIRVRHHCDTARIEVPAGEFVRFEDERLRKKISAKFKELGFSYSAVDLEGYRTGSLNETLTDLEKAL